MNRESENKICQIDLRNSKSEISIKKAEKIQTPVKVQSPIISFTGKKRKFRFSFRRLIMPLISIFTAYLLLSLYLETRLADQILELARAQAEKHLSETVNRVVGEMAQNGDLHYDRLVNTVHNEKGQVIYLEVDTARLTGAGATLVEKIDEGLEKNKKIVLSVPLGSLSGWNLFSGVGYPVRIKIYPIGMTEGKIDTVLEDCGINQTRHLIRVKVRAKLLLVLPGDNVEVETEVTLPLGERIIVGDVPEIYLDKIGAR